MIVTIVAMRVPPPKDRLTAADVTFLISVLGEAGNEDAIGSLLRDEDSLRHVLDLPAVFSAVIESPAIVGISPALYFYVVVRRVFRDGGLDDVPLTRYVACVLSGKVRPARHHTGDRPLPDYAIDFIERIQTSHGVARFDLWVAAGDHFLVLTGLYADFLRRRCEDRGAPSLDFYEEFGSRAYRAAGDHPRARDAEITGTLHRLSDAFGEARRALNRAAEQYLFLSS
jgi:hypothetical protein